MSERWEALPAGLTREQCFRLIEIAETTKHDHVRELALQMLEWELNPPRSVAISPEQNEAMKFCSGLQWTQEEVARFNQATPFVAARVADK